MGDTSLARRDSLGRLRDSLRARGDTLGIDTTAHWVVYLDSTARIAQFVHHRQDEPAVSMFPLPLSSLYLDIRSPAYQRDIQLDSTGRFITVREMVNGVDVKVPTTMPLEDYIHQRYLEEEKNNWRTFAVQYTMKEEKDQLAGILGSLTNIDIPVPANPLFSIFGGRGINLHVSGGVDLHGAFRNQSSDVSTVSQLDKSRSEPDFRQDVQVNVSGTVGQKLNILADWNTQRTFEYENQLKIKYTGFDDEIVQSVEAGNVSLQTPGLIGGGQALFGIKAKMQMGPLILTTLLSQKKGQTKEITVSGGSQSNEIDVPPEQYSTNHFFIDTVYEKYYEPLHASTIPTITGEMLQNQILQMDVWVNLTSAIQVNQDANVKYARSYIDLPAIHDTAGYRPTDLANLSAADGRYYNGLFKRLDPNKDYSYDKMGGFINLFTNVTNDQTVAVSYTIAGPNNASQTFGGKIAGIQDTIVLRLVKPPYLQPSYRPAWDQMMKNIYPLRISNVKKDGFDLRVWRRTNGADVDQVQGQNLLALLGLDRFNDQNAPAPDNKFDFLPGLTIDVDHGEIMFPTLRPFDSTIARYFRGLTPPQIAADSLLFSDPYDTTVFAAQNNTDRNKYTIKVKASGTQSSRYSLGFNLVEGSVQVLLNGQTLTPNVDYTVDYIVGEVVIRKPEALLPNAQVQVKYEQNDLFQLASKSLIGARGEMPNIFPNTNIGFTIMNLNQATLSDKVRLGEEPTNNTIMGFDASTSMNLPFLTDAINALPFIRTKEMSTLRFGGEAAYMIPDPNTKRSTVVGEGDQSIAYVDDFEGARRTIPLSINYSAWTLSSAPAYSLLAPGLPDSEKTYSKARLVWHNNSNTFQPVVTQDIWPNRQTRTGQNNVLVLNLEYDPSHRGMYNFSPKLDSTLHRSDPLERSKNWNGLMRYIGNMAGSILDQNIGYLEIWMKSNSSNIDDLRRGKLYIDLGRVSEDVIPNGKLDSEDKVPTSDNPSGIPNGAMRPEKDVGLDMLSDAQEAVAFSSFLASNRGDPDVNPADPSGDDYAVAGLDSIPLGFNGTENNFILRDLGAGAFPNTEDLNGNGSLDQPNVYAEYEVPLDTVYIDSTNVLRQNDLKIGGGFNGNGWYQFRIPLLNATRIIGGEQSAQSVLQNVQYMRMWLSGFADPVQIRIAEMDLVGNQWLERSNDSLLKVSVVNLEDNTDYAKDWNQMGIARENDKTDPTQIIQTNEQSLALLLNGLPVDSTRQAVKKFNVRPLDVFNYKSMRMFVHGDQTFFYADTSNYDASIFLRFGTDSTNFYEYSEPIHQGWNLPMNNMNIVFAQLTALKARRDSLNLLYREPVPGGPPGSTYGVMGSPSLRQIREISIGITNHGRTGLPAPLYGQVWVNELRVVDVNNSKGTAFHFETQMKLADLGAFGFNYAQTDPDFHGLDQQFGSQSTNINWGLSANLALDRFFPVDWQGTSIPVAYSHVENLLKPRYLPNSDVVVAEAAARSATPALADGLITSSQALHVQDSYSLANLRIVPPNLPWYFRDTFTKLTLAFNYNTSMDRDPSIEARKNWSWNFRLGYGVAIPPDYYIQPFKSIFNGIFLLDDFKDWKLYYVPISNFQAGLGGQRSRSLEVARSLGSLPRDTRNFGASKSLGFGWKLTENGLLNLGGDYGLSIDRNLLPLDNDGEGRSFARILRNVLIGGTDARYGQHVAVNTKPKIPNVFDIPKYLDLTMSYSVDYNWQNTFQGGDRGKSAGWGNNIGVQMGFRLKSLTDPWFAVKEEQPQAPSSQAARRGAEREEKAPLPQDTTKGKKPVETKPDTAGNAKNLFVQLKSLARMFIKIPLLDYETINISFTQNNRSGNGAVVGTTGFQNFWARLPFQGSVLENGPSRLYQLGLISDPSGTLRFSPHSSFPFIGWEVEPGLRAPGAVFSDLFNQANNIGLRTSRPLWEGASLELNWKVGWQFSKSTTDSTDALGRQYPGIPTTGGSVERSFLTFPPVLFFKAFKSNLEDVGKKFDENPLKDQAPNVALAQAFEKGFEALPWLNKVFGQYVPRPNWTLRWDGVEKLIGIKSFVERMSLEHGYTSSFRRDFRIYPGQGEQTDAERMTYGFSPLAGINMTFKDFLKGSLSGTIRLNSTNSYDLNLAASQANIVETASREISLSFTYSRRGFSFPLFGVNLSNDIEVSMTFSQTKNSRRRYDAALLSSQPDGTPLEGSTRTQLEPRIRYVLSSRVTAALFYRLTKTEPDEGAALIFGTTTNEAGVDIHISI